MDGVFWHEVLAELAKKGIAHLPTMFIPSSYPHRRRTAFARGTVAYLTQDRGGSRSLNLLQHAQRRKAGVDALDADFTVARVANKLEAGRIFRVSQLLDDRALHPVPNGSYLVRLKAEDAGIV